MDIHPSRRYKRLIPNDSDMPRMNIKATQKTSRLDLLSHIVKFRLDELGKSKSYVAVVVLLIAAVFSPHCSVLLSCCLLQSARR